MAAKNRNDVSEAEREIVATRVFDAPRELVFEAFKDPVHISNWWGPNGFTTTTYSMDVRPGGQWLFTMHGPDGTDYPNRVRYTEVKPPELLAYDHDAGETRPDFEMFKVWITFESEGRKTRVTLRLLAATRERRDEMAKFGAVEGAHQTLARLDLHLTGKEGNAVSKSTENQKTQPFVISRIFDAPRDLVFKVFTDPEHMKHWWGPKGFKVIASEMDLRPGGTFHYGMQAPDGSTMWGRFVYREISAPERVVLINSFSDAEGGITRHPMSPGWPLELLSVFTLEELDDGRTKLTINWSPYNASDDEIETFDKGRPSMTQGWSGTLEQLEAYLARIQKNQSLK